MVEVLMASGIAGIVMVALFGAFSNGFSTIRVNQESVRADQILVEKLETFRMYPWSSITNSGFITPTNFTTRFCAGNGVTNGVTYNGTIQVSPAVTSPPLNNLYSNSLRQITVTLNWTSAGVPRTRTMSTLVTRNGIQSLSNQ